MFSSIGVLIKILSLSFLKESNMKQSLFVVAWLALAVAACTPADAPVAEETAPAYTLEVAPAFEDAMSAEEEALLADEEAAEEAGEAAEEAEDVAETEEF
jgi:hypothetical protein